MPTSKICTDVVTLYNYAGEVDFVATYSTTVLYNVTVHTARSSSPPGNHSNAATLCIFDENLEAMSVAGYQKSFMPNSEWIELPPEERQLYWTLDAKQSGKDFFVLGEHGDEPPACIDRYRVQSAEWYNRGTSRVRHWKVVGK